MSLNPEVRSWVTSPNPLVLFVLFLAARNQRPFSYIFRLLACFCLAFGFVSSVENQDIHFHYLCFCLFVLNLLCGLDRKPFFVIILSLSFFSSLPFKASIFAFSTTSPFIDVVALFTYLLFTSFLCCFASFVLLCVCFLDLQFSLSLSAQNLFCLVCSCLWSFVFLALVPLFISWSCLCCFAGVVFLHRYCSCCVLSLCCVSLFVFVEICSKFLSVFLNFGKLIPVRVVLGTC